MISHSPADDKRRIKSLRTSPPQSPTAMRVWEFVRSLCPQAPRPGLKAWIYLGVVKTGDRVHHVTCRGTNSDGVRDVPHACVITGYQIHTAAAAGVWPWDADTVRLSVKVRLLDWVTLRRRGFDSLLKRDISCDVSCLRCVPSGFKIGFVEEV